ncbi:MAG: 6-phosphogluconolactonase, partial [Proteobacteria bacterium]
AQRYEEILREHLGESQSFDLVLSGMGDDGHTASLFPGTKVLHEQTKWVVAYYLEPQQMYRITLTAPLLNKAKQNVVLVFGANKAHAFGQVISGEFNPDKYPSQLLKPDSGELLWLTDESAAAELPPEVEVARFG